MMRFRKLPSGLVINLDHVVSMREKDGGVSVFSTASEEPHIFRDADGDALRAFIERETLPIDPEAR